MKLSITRPDVWRRMLNLVTESRAYSVGLEMNPKHWSCCIGKFPDMGRCILFGPFAFVTLSQSGAEYVLREATSEGLL